MCRKKKKIRRASADDPRATPRTRGASLIIQRRRFLSAASRSGDVDARPVGVVAKDIVSTVLRQFLVSRSPRVSTAGNSRRKPVRGCPTARVSSWLSNVTTKKKKHRKQCKIITDLPACLLVLDELLEKRVASSVRRASGFSDRSRSVSSGEKYRADYSPRQLRESGRHPSAVDDPWGTGLSRLPGRRRRRRHERPGRPPGRTRRR